MAKKNGRPLKYPSEAQLSTAVEAYLIICESVKPNFNSFAVDTAVPSPQAIDFM